jgi:hypothetical protein
LTPVWVPDADYEAVRELIGFHSVVRGLEEAEFIAVRLRSADDHASSRTTQVYDRRAQEVTSTLV